MDPLKSKTPEMEPQGPEDEQNTGGAEKTVGADAATSRRRVLQLLGLGAVSGTLLTTVGCSEKTAQNMSPAELDEKKPKYMDDFMWTRMTPEEKRDLIESEETREGFEKKAKKNGGTGVVSWAGDKFLDELGSGLWEGARTAVIPVAAKGIQAILSLIFVRLKQSQNIKKDISGMSSQTAIDDRLKKIEDELKERQAMLAGGSLALTDFVVLLDSLNRIGHTFQELGLSTIGESVGRVISIIYVCSFLGKRTVKAIGEPESLQKQMGGLTRSAIRSIEKEGTTTKAILAQQENARKTQQAEQDRLRQRAENTQDRDSTNDIKREEILSKERMEREKLAVQERAQQAALDAQARATQPRILGPDGKPL